MLHDKPSLGASLVELAAISMDWFEISSPTSQKYVAVAVRKNVDTFRPHQTVPGCYDTSRRLWLSCRSAADTCKTMCFYWMQVSLELISRGIIAIATQNNPIRAAVFFVIAIFLRSYDQSSFFGHIAKTNPAQLSAIVNVNVAPKTTLSLPPS